MELKTKTGRLTRYGLACGYIERAANTDVSATLLMTGSTIKVEVFNYETKQRAEVIENRVKKARQYFDQFSRKWKLERTI